MDLKYVTLYFKLGSDSVSLSSIEEEEAIINNKYNVRYYFYVK